MRCGMMCYFIRFFSIRFDVICLELRVGFTTASNLAWKAPETTSQRLLIIAIQLSGINLSSRPGWRLEGSTSKTTTGMGPVMFLLVRDAPCFFFGERKSRKPRLERWADYGGPRHKRDREQSCHAFAGGKPRDPVGSWHLRELDSRYVPLTTSSRHPPQEIRRMVFGLSCNLPFSFGQLWNCRVSSVSMLSLSSERGS